MFREAYRKANDGIHAPQSILAAIDAKIEAESASEEDAFAFEPQKRRIWPRVLAYSGAGVAVAALALLVIFPIGPMLSGGTNENTSASAQKEAELVYSMAADMAVSEEEMVETAEVTMATSAQNVFPETYADEGLEDDDFLEYDADVSLETTYAEIFRSLSLAEPLTETTKRPTDTDPTEETSQTSEVRTEDGCTWRVPADRTLLETVTADPFGDRICAIQQGDESVYVTVLQREGEILIPVGETAQSGVYEFCEVQEAAVFNENGYLETHWVLLVTSCFAPDLNAADEVYPETYCPMLFDADGRRVLAADAVSIYNVGTVFTVYGATEPDTGRMLYAFAELGLE